MRRVRFLSIFAFAVFFIFLQPLTVFGEEINPAFNPNVLVPDTVFPDTKTFTGPEGIQKFLESKGSVLANTTKEFLLQLHEPDDSFLKQNLEDPQPNLARPRTAAELIWDAASLSGLNPQVILVTLNKEQGLITGKVRADKIQRALDHSMGFACPDNSGCDTLLAGFYFQLFGNVDTEGNRYLGATKSLMKSFRILEFKGLLIDGKNAQVGDSVVLSNTLGSYNGVEPQQTLTIGNRATGALYRYTPHVFDGNYNFWRFFTSWFKYPNGTVLKDTASDILYILEGDGRREIPHFVAQARKINLNDIVTASPTELNNYALGSLYGPPNNTIVSLDGRTYLFLKDIKYPASNVVLKQKRLNPGKALHISKAEAALFADGPQLLPRDGTILRARGKTGTYLVKKGVLKLFNAISLKQYRARDRAQLIAESELMSYPRVGYVAPRDGTLIKTRSSGTVYLMNRGKKRPLTHALFVNLKYSRSAIGILHDAEIQDIPAGTFVTPRSGTYFSIDKKPHELYLFVNGAVHSISNAVARKRRIKQHFTFDAAVVKDWPQGAPIMK